MATRNMEANAYLEFVNDQRQGFLTWNPLPEGGLARELRLTFYPCTGFRTSVFLYN